MELGRTFALGRWSRGSRSVAGSYAVAALAWVQDLAPNILLIPGTRTREHLAETLGRRVCSTPAARECRAALSRFPTAQFSLSTVAHRLRFCVSAGQ